MFGAWGFGQGYFAEGPMGPLAGPVSGPIRVRNLDDCHPEALNLTSKKARVSRPRVKKPSVTNTEQC